MSFSLFVFWLALVWSLGWLFFPISCRIFGDILPDDGLAVGRILALGIWTFAAFWVARAGVSVALCAWFFLPIAGLGIWLWKREKNDLDAVFQRKKRPIWSGEILFLTVFLVGFGLRGFWSDTNGTNGEKGMDAMLIGTLARAPKLPPQNPYAAGAEFRSYYLFGHLETALLTKATGTTVRWSYNLMCASLPALCVSALFSLGAALTKRLWGGAFVCLAVLFLGTLSPLYQWTHPDPYSPSKFLRLDFFGVSRVIPYSINEFPFFTFNQSDLHAHYFDFQFQIAAMCLAFALFLKPSRLTIAFSGLVLGAMICTNTWDFPAYFLVVSLAILLGQTLRPSKKLSAICAILFGALLLASPFLLGLKSAAGTPKPLPLPASPLREWLLLWGIFVLAWGYFLAKTVFEKKTFAQLGLLSAAQLVFCGAILSGWGYPPGVTAPYDLNALAVWKSPSNLNWLVWPTMLGCALGALFGVWKLRETPRFLAVLAFAGLVSLIFAESTWSGFLGSADNPMVDDFKRQDTVFKFGLQTWFLWGTTCAAGGFLTFKKWLWPVQIVVVQLFVVMSLGSIAVVNGRARGFSEWDGWDAWAHLQMPEKEAARWLEQNVPPSGAMLEAEPKLGGDYSASPRFAHATGIPTVVGPQAHTFQWSPANSGDAGQEWTAVFDRKKDARAIYENTVQRAALLRKYGVRFIVWGELERGEYAPPTESSLNSDPKLQSAALFGAPSDPHRVEIFKVLP